MQTGQQFLKIRGRIQPRITTSPNEKDIIAPADFVSVQIVEGQVQLARQAPHVLVIRVDQFTAAFARLIFVEKIPQSVTASAEPR